MTYLLAENTGSSASRTQAQSVVPSAEIVVCVTSIPRSAIIWAKSRELSLYLRYQRTQSTIISRSKCRPLNKSNALILDHYHRPFQPSQSLHQNPLFHVWLPVLPANL